MIPAIADRGVPATGRSRRRVFAQPAAWFGLAAIALALTGCAPPAADTPMSQPVVAMEAPWGPFARQCDGPRVSHTALRWRLGETEVAQVYETCVGFSVMMFQPECRRYHGKRRAAQSSILVRNLAHPAQNGRHCPAGSAG